MGGVRRKKPPRRERVLGLKQVVEAHSRKLLLKAADETVNTNVVGAPPAIASLRGLVVRRGEFIPEEDEFYAFAVGLIFGLYPAHKAASLYPIAALRTA